LFVEQAGDGEQLLLIFKTRFAEGVLQVHMCATLITAQLFAAWSLTALGKQKQLGTLPPQTPDTT
jgi:hypothetical protein